MNLSFRQISAEIKESFTCQGIFSGSISEKIFDIFGYYTTPIFLKLRISGNSITSFGLLFSVFAAAAIAFGWLITGLVFYAAAILCDHLDGRVARATNNATFFGRFYDGLANIFTYSLIRIGLIYLILNRHGLNSLAVTGLVSLALTPCYHFIYDRYSAFCRWINEEKKTNITPYIRKAFIVKIASISEDVERLSLILCLFLFLPGIWIYFVTGIIVSLSTISYHLYNAFINMRISNL